MALQIYLLGHMQVTDDATNPEDRLRSRAKRLLAYLLLQRRAALARDRVAFTLWPDNPEKEALSLLRRALSELRATLPPLPDAEWIIAAHGELRWNLEAPYWLDVEEFERSVRQATPAALSEAVALYAGDLLPDLGDEWTVVERERLRQLALNAMAQLAAHQRALGEYTSALDLVRRSLALDPLAEASHRELIALSYLTGDRAAALAAYERLRATLQAELGVEPMAETLALVEAINRGAPLPATPAPPMRPTRVQPQDLPPPIGREAEMSDLSALWEMAASGRGRLAIVSGEAGVGKSHLVCSLADYVTRRGGLALSGQCYEFERALPYQAVVEMLRSAARLLPHVELPPAYRRWLAVLAPDLLGAAGQPVEYEQAAESETRAQMFEALLQTFLALARLQPLLLVLEDAQWASASTLDWLTYVAPRLREGRVFVVVTYRTGEFGARHTLARLQRRYAREGSVSVVPVGALSREAVRQWVAQVSGLDEDAAVPAADRLYAETGGNPFFLQEVVRGLTESGQIAMVGQRWTGSFLEMAAEAPVVVPDTLRDAINARVERLATKREAFLRCASAAGVVFDFDAVRLAGGWDEESSLEALEDLLARRFIRRGGSEGQFAFIHHLVREAVYSALSAPRRRYWHRRIATATEALHAANDEWFAELLHHFEQGQVWEKAIEYGERAGRLAEARRADDQAVKHYTSAIEALKPARLEPTPNARRRQFELLASRESVLSRLGDRDAQRRDLEAMEILAQSLGPGDRAAASARRAFFCEKTGDYPAAREAARAGLESARQAKESRLEVECLNRWGRAAWLMGDFEEALKQTGQALRLAQAIGDRAGEVLGLNTLGVVHDQMGDRPAAIAYYESVLRLARETGNRAAEALSLNNLGNLHHNAGDLVEARSLLHQAVEIWREIGDRWGQALSLSNLGDVHTSDGDYAAARRLLEAALSVRRSIDDRRGVANTLRDLGFVGYRLGDYAAALDRLERSIALGVEVGDQAGRAEGLVIKGMALGEAGRAEEAREWLAQSIALYQGLNDRQGEAAALHAQGQVLERSGDHAGAEAAYRRAVEYWRQVGLEGRAMEGEARLARVALRRRERAGAETEALTAGGEALAEASAYIGAVLGYIAEHGTGRMSDPLTVFHICFRVLAARGEADQAREVLGHAHALLMARAEGLEADQRQTFLTQVSTNRAVMEDWYNLVQR